MRYCQEKGIVCQYAGTNMHCSLTACVFPRDSVYPATKEGHMMDIEKLIEQLKYYGTTYAIGDSLGKEIDGSDELMLNAATALSTLQAENEKLRAELEQVKQERDEAVECLRGQCRYCKRNFVCTSRKGPHSNCWEWGGMAIDIF